LSGAALIRSASDNGFGFKEKGTVAAGLGILFRVFGISINDAGILIRNSRTLSDFLIRIFTEKGFSAMDLGFSQRTKLIP
jgi:hypothetical protein